MFDVYNNTAPHNISHLFTSTQQIHSYRTRSSYSGNITLATLDWIRKMIRFLLGEPKFGIAYLKIYEIRQNLSLRKKFNHAILLKIFEGQDSYADLNTIISDFKNISPRLSK